MSGWLAGLTVAIAFAASAPNPAPAPTTLRAGERWENALGMRFAPVPGTAVLFSIWETRVRDFAAFVDATGHDATGNVYSLDVADGQWKVHPTNSWRSPGFAQTPDHAVINVSWNDAVAFCRWLTARDRAAGLLAARQEYRLPTDAEWSTAVGPTKYPWGEQWPPTGQVGNYYGGENRNPKRPVVEGHDDGAPFTSAVGRYPPNAHGLYDLGGNAWEYCADFYRAEMNSEEIRRERPTYNDDGGGTTYRMMRGGGWAEGASLVLQSGFRSRGRATNRYCMGFRVVLADVAATAELAPPNRR